jgi:hypothetical protein
VFLVRGPTARHRLQVEMEDPIFFTIKVQNSSSVDHFAFYTRIETENLVPALQP